MNSNHDTASETAPVARQGANNAPETKTTTKKVSPRKGAHKAKKATKHAKARPTGKQAATAGVPREFSKKAIVLDLLRRKNGATMAEIAKATQWQNHSIRGFLSGEVSKRMGLTIESTKNAAGERCYAIIGKS